MSARRPCQAVTAEGDACRARPLRSGAFCFWHSPEHAQEASEARRLGGLRRRRDAAVSGAFELDDLEGTALVRRILEVAVIDTLSLENSVARSRALAQLANVALRAEQGGELEARLAALESVVRRPRRRGELK